MKVAVIFANLKGNIGDFAILQSILVDITSRQPHVSIDVYSQPFVTVDSARLEAFKMNAPDFTYRGTTVGTPIQIATSRAKLLDRFRLLRFYQALRIGRLARSARQDLAEKFDAYEAVFVAGGAQWVGFNSGVSMFANLNAIRKASTKVFTYPVSVSSVVWRYHRKAELASYLKQIQSPLIARDSQTLSIFERLGLDGVLGADCVFALAEESSIAPSAREAKNRVIFVVTNQDYATLKTAIRATRAAGMEPAFLTTCEIEDAPVQKNIADAEGVKFIAPITWQEAVDEMRESALVVTNRLHGLILASFTPACVMPLVDRSKVKAVVDDAQLPIRIDTLASLTASKLQDAVNQNDEIKRRLLDYRAKAKKLRWSPLART